MEEQRERNQVAVTGAPADLDRSGRRPLPSRVVTGVELLTRHRQQQVAPFGAVLRLVFEEPVGPGQPTVRLRDVSPAHQMERQPERVPRGPPRVTALCVELLSALQCPQALLDAADQMRCGRQQLQILPGQGGRLIGQQQRGVGIRPSGLAGFGT